MINYMSFMAFLKFSRFKFIYSKLTFIFQTWVKVYVHNIGLHFNLSAVSLLTFDLKDLEYL